MFNRGVAFMVATTWVVLIGSGCRDSGSAGGEGAVPTQAASTAVRMHDHRPHHGGVVSMVGMNHIEAVANSAGRVVVYVSDQWRTPVTLSGWTGVAVVQVGNTKQQIELALAKPDQFAGTAQPIRGDQATVAVRLTPPDGPTIESYFLISMRPGVTGGAGLPASGCEPAPVAPGLHPECMMRFARSITAISAGRTEGDLLIAAEDSGITRWKLESGEFVLAFEAPPAVSVTTEEEPHALWINAIELSPDRLRVAVALENRVLLYDSDTGKLLAESPPATGVVRSMAWSPDGELLYVSRFYARGTLALDGHKMTRKRDIALGQDPGILEVANEKRLASLGDDGALTLIDTLGGGVFGSRPGGKIGARVIERFKDEYFYSAGDDGIVRRWPLLEGASTVFASTGRPVSALAIEPTSGRLAIGGVDGMLRVHDGADWSSLVFHDAQVFAVRWLSMRLVSGDANGNVAVWRLRADSNY